MAGVAAVAPAGNTYDKYGTANPVARRLVARFLGELDRMIDLAAPHALLDVGCGEGIVTARMARRSGARRTVGLDRAGAQLRAHWDARRGDGMEFVEGDAHALPFADGSFDLACAIEMLMQSPEPQLVLAELRRVARRHVLVSAPREPLWRALNVARGAYLRRLGNSPGNERHFSARGLVALCRAAGEPVAVARPLPWTMVLVRVD
jgi:ubiquinone/menaquinone biosynthesis C-methylase UbiE